MHSSCFIKIEKTPCDFRDLSALVLAPEIVEWYGSDLGAVSGKCLLYLLFFYGHVCT